MRLHRVVFLVVLSLLVIAPIDGQSPNGTISGIVVDSSGAAIVGAEILIANDATGVQYPGKTNGEGFYLVPNLPPGTYRLQVSNSGFKTIIKPDVVIHVQDALAINFTLPVGSTSVIVTVEGGAPLINTMDASVSTVVDRQYLENMPLNGRSFQDLILLTPGVVTNTPQTPANAGSSGEFSVNGQRTESNYYTVDGVSANVGVHPGLPDTAGTTGSLPASTALGTTQGLVSVDALQEFRIESSTYAPEYGRNPGGQFSFVTRSGTAQWHATVFEYLRNNAFDANDWFDDYFGVAQPAERQNDFGGTLGGPIKIPGVHAEGQKSTFFFFSYEGLRLDQPQAATVTYVPDATLRANTPAPLQQVLNGFPLPTPGAPDLGTGLAEFIGTWSNPSHIDSYGIRLDQVMSDKLRLFFRFSDTPSAAAARGLAGVASNLNSTRYTTRTYTFGATSLFSSRINNEFRLNYSSNEGVFETTPTAFGGATAVDLIKLQGLRGGMQPSSTIQIGLFLGTQFPTIIEGTESSSQNQWNIVDSVALLFGRHQLKFGFDFRRLSPSVYQFSPVALYRYFSASSVETNSVDLGIGESFAPAFPVYANYSTFAQDEWRIAPRLNMNFGLRWEVNPAPDAAGGNLPYTVEGSNLRSLVLAPEGTALWRTAWFNIAPRLGLAYALRKNHGYETALRGGAGVFFDTAQQLGSFGYIGPGFSALNEFGALLGSPASFPAATAQVNPAIVNPPVAPYRNSVFAFPAHLQLPYTLQWNVSMQQALGKSDALTISYVGSHGAKLLEEKEVDVGLFNPNFTSVFFLQNGHTSDYNALQAQFQRRLNRGLQVLASYTWSHSIDYSSFNFVVPYERANSDFDVRHNLSGALMYDLPSPIHRTVARTLLDRWGVDDRFTARTGFPVPLQGTLVTDPTTGQSYYSGLNLLPGQPLYIHGSRCSAAYGGPLGCPDGWAINPNAFSLPAGCTPFNCQAGSGAGDAPRNFARGLGAWQMDLALRREFRLHERAKLLFRVEAFNFFNHPNFGTVNSTYCSVGPGCTFGQASATLANSLGGLSPLYQMGGPRSMQFALKLTF